jgi:hypothetical protein
MRQLEQQKLAADERIQQLTRDNRALEVPSSFCSSCLFQWWERNKREIERRERR